jgi:hypothetical protein
MIKFVLKIFNLNGSSLHIRSKHRATSAGTQKCGMRFELSEFQRNTIKQASNTGMHKPQIRIVNHNHIALITWFGTHIIVRGSKKAISKESLFSSRLNFLFSRKTLQNNLSWLQGHFQAR